MMSGASGTNFNIMSGLVAGNTATVARSVGCTQNPDSQATLNCLRNVPLETLMNVSVSLARQTRPPFGELASILATTATIFLIDLLYCFGKELL